LGLKIKPYAATLSLGVSNPSPAYNSSVVFTASRSPASVGTLSMPMTVLQWTWTPDNPADGAPACSPGTTCTIAQAKGSGVMSVQAVVNGDVQTQSIRITVNACPPLQEAVLNQQSFRDGLFAQLQLARTNPKFERGGWQYQLPDGRIAFTNEAVPNAFLTDCHMDWGGPDPAKAPPGGVLMQEQRYHVHPVGKGEKYWTCKGPDQNGNPVLPGQMSLGENNGSFAGDANTFGIWLVNNSNAALWTLTSNERLYKMDQQHPDEAHMAAWKYDHNDAHHCFTPLP
jgi:hypothetical protein